MNADLAYLALYLDAPLQSWGYQSRFDRRTTLSQPTRSGIVGMICAAMGIDRADVARLASLADLNLTVYTFQQRGRLVDFHTIGGGWDKAQVLTIMKDSRVGSYAALGVGMILLTKWSALTELDTDFGPPFLALALIAGHSVSRLASTVLIFFLDYVREDASAKSKPLAQRMARHELAIAIAIGLAPCLLLPPQEVLVAISAVALSTLLAARYFVRRIGGYTGDCLGATQQLSEVAFYLGLLCSFT